MSDSSKLSLDHQINFYNRYWNELKPFSSYKVYRIQKILHCLVWVRKKLTDLNILDLGCGDGRAVAIWNVLGKSSGIDLSTQAMENAKRLFPSLEFKAEDATKTKYNSESFNIIISQEVLEHIENQRSYILECNRLLTSGGYLILTTPNKYYFDRIAGGNYSKQPIENILDAEALKTLVTEFFRIEKLESTILAKGDFGVYKVLSNRFVVGILNRLGLDFIRILLMEKYLLGVHLCLVARKP